MVKMFVSGGKAVLKSTKIIWAIALNLTLTLLSSTDAHYDYDYGNTDIVVNEKDEYIIENNFNKLRLMYNRNPAINNQYEFCEWATREQIGEDGSLYISKECYKRNKDIQMYFDGKPHFAYFAFSHGNYGKLAVCSNPVIVSMSNCTHGNKVYSVCYHNCNGVAKRAICKLNGTLSNVTTVWEGSECPSMPEEECSYPLNVSMYNCTHGNKVSSVCYHNCNGVPKHATCNRNGTLGNVTILWEGSDCPPIPKEDEEADASGLGISHIIAIIFGILVVVAIGLLCLKYCRHITYNDEEADASRLGLSKITIICLGRVGAVLLLLFCFWKHCRHKEKTIAIHENELVKDNPGTGGPERSAPSNGEDEVAVRYQPSNETVQHVGAGGDMQPTGMSELRGFQHGDHLRQSQSYSDRLYKEDEEESQGLMKCFSEEHLDLNSLASKGPQDANNKIGQAVSDRNVEGAFGHRKPSDANKDIGRIANLPVSKDDGVKCTTSVDILLKQKKPWMDKFCELAEVVSTKVDDTMVGLAQQMPEEFGFQTIRGPLTFERQQLVALNIPSEELLQKMSSSGLPIGVLVDYFNGQDIIDHILDAHPGCNYCQREARRKKTAAAHRPSDV